ncbi:lipocalin family protein [Achromobacter piechaudii]|uniref:Outer membrane lipoprotein Blc n=1 Tax=Achromobacter piechaudii TaxID=72556 RepID=A0ABN7F0W3_9BURK|nr:lipocalin family protein [Achromobacter piechaudii]CAB3694298.1 Outer membrane lipoprotein Blc [Achromobacter piechaudii]CAB3858488.1 Outer membrane lipoprotein Blc [Achromobacter piechaudii]CAB3949921.1 Outer membrane lipoprotein Blc [Achromobacter piechaudii]
MRKTLSVAAAAMIAALTGCGSPTPMPPVAQVNLPRFMGDWYVIAGIPTWPERASFNAVESYALLPDGRIQTTFRYRHGGFDAKVKTMRPEGTVEPNTGNAIWGMQFIWPIQAEYVIAYVDENYQQTIIGRSKRDYVWIMARTPTLPDADYARLVDKVRELGYDPALLRRVPQQWPEQGPEPRTYPQAGIDPDRPAR